ncbi:MAG: hypothetical protein ABIP37_00690, partial [Methylotenera sp.]
MKRTGFMLPAVRLQNPGLIKCAVIIAALTLGTTTANLALAGDSATVTTQPIANMEVGEASPAPSGSNAKIDFSSVRQANKSYLIPALEIVGFDFLLNQFNRRYSGISDYDSNLSTIRDNLKSSW